MKHFIALFMLVTLVVACNPDNNSSTTDFRAANETEITEFIAKNSLNAEKSDSGLYYVIDNPGDGEQPSFSDNVTVAYKGYFTSGNVFDESSASGISFDLNRVIAGWTEGITYFKEGGSGMLLIPSHLAYRNAGRPGIPGGAVLIFDINLISVN